MTDLSVIIPIYNTPEEELKRVFSSLSGLSGFTWEAVLIDDGSGPSVGDFCSAWAEKDSRFRYFYKENGGVSSARNMGLDQAQGRYVTFVDADDELLADAITPELFTAQLVLFDIELDGRPWHALEQPTGEISPWALHQQLTGSKSLNSPCAKLFLRSVIEENSLRFDEKFVTAEDWSFVWDYCKNTQSGFYKKACVYRYHRDAGSGTGRLKKFPDVMLQNLMAVYEKKSRLPALYPNENTAAVLNRAAAITAEDLFNACADLYLMKMLTKSRKATVKAFIKGLLTDHPALPKKALLKARVLANFWLLLPPLALARRQYLK